MLAIHAVQHPLGLLQTEVVDVLIEGLALLAVDVVAQVLAVGAQMGGQLLQRQGGVEIVFLLLDQSIDIAIFQHLVVFVGGRCRCGVDVVVLRRYGEDLLLDDFPQDNQHIDYGDDAPQGVEQQVAVGRRC